MCDLLLQMQASETRSHYAALAFVVVWVFETQSLFGTVLLQVRQLLAVDGASALSMWKKQQQQIPISYINVWLVIFNNNNYDYYYYYYYMYIH